MSETQTNQILELLETGNWICTSEMYRLYMADPRRRLCDLKDKGYELECRRCQQHTFHKGGSKEWRLNPSQTPETAPGTLFRTTATLNPKYCCGDRLRGLQSHAKDCKVEKVKERGLW